MKMAIGGFRKSCDSADGMILNSDECEGCDGSGIRVPARPSCSLPELPDGWCIVERCDTCMTYADDYEAGSSISANPRWIKCASGGWHVVIRR